MSLRPSLVLAGAAAAALTAIAAQAAPTAAPSDHQNCFLGRDWEGWTAPGDGDALILRVHLNDYYKVELTKGSHVRKDPDRFLVNKQRGSSWICSPLDLDLQIADHSGFRQPLIARSLRKLTAQEVAAIPKKDLP
jgi:hypothetical protein